MLDAETLTDLAALPWQLQLVLASGYVGYLLAFVGIRHTHKAADTVFGTLAFGLFALAALALVPASWHWAVAGGLAISAALLAAVLWRWIVRGLLRRALRDDRLLRPETLVERPEARPRPLGDPIRR